jgi:uncharacterized protein (TIGR02246 family)
MTDGKVRGGIDAANRKLAEATRRKSASEMASLYAENATFIGPDGTPVAGRTAIEAMWKMQIEGGLSSVDLKTLSVEDLAPGMYVELGTYEVTVGGTSDVGRYMVIWRRSAEGAMQLYVDVPVSHAAGK